MNDLLLRQLEAIAAERAVGAEPGHDFLHVKRVTENARRIGEAEGANLAILLPATLLHELFNYPKNHPESHLSGDVCAEEAAAVLRSVGYPAELIEPICYCIRYHSFSRGVLPETLEGRIMQDADRLDAIGAIGIARCFSTGSQMGIPFYSEIDPFCREREPNDKAYSLDHFYRKLLRIPGTLHTETGRAMATQRVAFLQQFLDQLEQELG